MKGHRDRLVARARGAAVAAGLGFPASALASMFKGEALDKVADVMAIVVLIVVPVVVIVLFWMVHVLPEKIAHKRHHPQRDAIQTLCLLSLVFGGLLWPIAWLWAYTKPVAYRVAYGTDKHDDYFHELGERHRAGRLSPAESRRLREELDEIRARGALTPELKDLQEELARGAPPAAAEPPATGERSKA